MVHALEGIPAAWVFSRHGRSEMTECVDLPFTGQPYRLLYDGLLSIPILRGRSDLLTLLSDLEFDASVSRAIDSPLVFDGVAGQCAQSLSKLDAGDSMRIVTCLNSHVDYLVRALEQEYRLLGVRESSFIHPRMQRRMKQEIEMADVIRVPSVFAKASFVDAGVDPEKVVVLPLAVDLRHFRSVHRKDDNTFRVLAVASFDPRKGVVYLLRAFEDLKIANSEVVLIGATGSRWGRRTLESFAHSIESLKVLQMDVTSESVSKSYGMASVFVHPAIEDGFGLVILQAMACGIPVIATRQSGASELITHGENGFIVEARRPDQIRDFVRLLAYDRDLRDQMGKRAHEAMLQHGYDSFARRVREFYAEVTSGSVQ